VSYKVELTRSALSDLEDIIDWICREDSIDRALHVLDEIQSRTDSLSSFPERGTVPPELRSLGIDKYREVFFKPYRIVYHVKEQRVIINLIADGRRDMSALLQRRLIAIPNRS
jgi:toxin ParE1/3/4